MFLSDSLLLFLGIYHTLSQPEGHSSDELADIQEEPISTCDTNCDSQCCQDTLDVFQVTDESVIKMTRRHLGHNRQFCPGWYKSYPWLILCTKRLQAYCAYCRYFNNKNLLTDKLGEAAFTTSKFNNWKNALQRFEQHAQSRIHKEAMLKIEMLKKPSIGAQHSSQVKKDQKI